jgi:hypothetical protein
MMNDIAIERVARQLHDQLCAGRRAVFTTTDEAQRQRVLARLTALLQGRALEESPD